MKLVQTMRIGGRLSLIEYLSLTSFIKNGHDVHLYAYEDIPNLPDGICLMDANVILPKSEIFIINGNHAFFSDYFRAKLLYAKGGIWVDTDMVSLKYFDFSEDLVYGYQDEETVCNAVFKLPANHHIAKILLDRIERPWDFRDINLHLPKHVTVEMIKRFPGEKYDSIIAKLIVEEGERYVKDMFYLYGAFGSIAGPLALTKVIEDLELKQTIKPITYFYPVHYINWWSLFYDISLPQKLNLKESYGIHLWNGNITKYKYFDTETLYQRDTVIHSLFKKYINDDLFLKNDMVP